VGNCIDNGFTYRIGGEFETNRSINALRASSNSAIDPRKDKLHRLVYKNEQIPFITLLGSKWTFEFCTEAVHALDFRRTMITLRCRAEQHYSSVCRPIAVQEAEMMQQ